MSYEIDAIYSDGAFVPVTPLTLPEGVRVHLRVDERANPVVSDAPGENPKQSRDLAP